MEETGEPADPGWRPALKYLIFFLFPYPLIFWAARRWGESRLVAMRGMHLAFALIVANCLSVIVALERNPAEGRATNSIGVVVFTAIAILPILAELFVRRYAALSCEDDHKLANSFTTLWSTEFAFSLSPGLLGIVGTFIFQELWPFFVGLPITAVGLGLSASSRRAIDRLQARLESEGCELSLRRALSEPPPRFREMASR